MEEIGTYLRKPEKENLSREQKGKSIPRPRSEMVGDSQARRQNTKAWYSTVKDRIFNKASLLQRPPVPGRCSRRETAFWLSPEGKVRKDAIQKVKIIPEQGIHQPCSMPVDLSKILQPWTMRYSLLNITTFNVRTKRSNQWIKRYLKGSGVMENG